VLNVNLNAIDATDPVSSDHLGRSAYCLELAIDHHGHPVGIAGSDREIMHDHNHSSAHGS
jgi:hypothetical protein